MTAEKGKSIRDRINAKKAAAQSGVPSVEPATTHAPPQTENPSSVQPSAASPHSAQTGSRAQRFGTIGDDHDTPPPQTENPSSVQPPAIEPPSATASRAQRFVALGQEHRQRTSSPIPHSALSSQPEIEDSFEPLVRQLEWDDVNRPAGTAYTEEQWRRAEEDNPDCTIYEMHKTAERALLVKEKTGLDVVLHRSLLIHHLVDSPWRANATASIEHRGEFGLHRYAIVRAKAQVDLFPWAEGSKLVVGPQPEEPAAQESGRQRAAVSRSERFRG